MYKNDKVIRRYSEPFKLKILDEITTGKLNKNQLGKLYGIAPTTINEWIRKYNRKDLMNTRVKVETKDEITRIKELQKEIEQLKKTMENGDIISVKAEEPLLHGGEDSRWDFRVTIVWKNAELGVGKEDPTLRYKKQLYPDNAKLDQDEQYRFSLLIAH